jgi:D-alanine-D-alanine ligase
MEVIFTDQAETAAYTTMNKKEYLERVAYQLLVNSEPLAMEAQELALAVYHIFGCRDAARVDLRCDAHGLLQFLEINPLPGLDHIYSDLPIMGRLAGVKYTEIINAIVNAAWQRYQCG